MLLQQSKVKNSHFTYVGLLLIIAILGYWQISFLKYTVTHDMINCWIPWRFYISECLQNHVFPFWNPYQQMGYPIHADLQGPTWYLESLLLGGTIGQSNYVVQLLFVFYVFMAGVGMYFLSLCFHNNKIAAFLTGVCYMLSGFFVAHVQHFYAVIGAAWIPFILLNYYKMHTERDHKRAIYASIFLFFNLTGGNHTFTFILSYLFICISAYFIFFAIKEKRKEIVFQLLKLNGLFIVLTAALSTVVFVVFWQVRPYIDRLSGISYKVASQNPLSPQSLLSFLVPYSTVNSMEFYNTDPSMCNIYVGVIILPFVILSIINKKTRLEKTLLIFAVVCLLASFGSYTPVHKLLFSYFPFINLFRFPSYFSLFTVMILLVLGGKQLATTIESFETNRKKLIAITVATICSVLFLLIVAFIKNRGNAFYYFEKFDSLFDFIKAGDLYQNIILQGTIQLIVLLALLTVLYKVKAHRIKMISVLVVLDLLISVQLNIAYVGFSPASPKELHDYVRTLPEGFPIPSTNNIIDNKEELGQKHGLYRNTSVFHKRISSDVFNSFCFKNQVMMIDSFPQLYDSMRTNPLVYFSNKISSTQAFEQKQVLITHKTIVLAPKDYEQVQSKLKIGSENVSSYIITSFGPNKITISTTVESPEVLTLLQNYYTGWNVTVDGKTENIMLSNYLTMSVLIPRGKHNVEFEYKNPAVVIGGIISYSVFLILLIVLSILWIKEKKYYIATALIWIVLIGSAVSYFL